MFRRLLVLQNVSMILWNSILYQICTTPNLPFTTQVCLFIADIKLKNQSAMLDKFCIVGISKTDRKSWYLRESRLLSKIKTLY